VQIARAAGAAVTGVCSKGNSEVVRSLGAEKVIDYRKQDFAESNDRYDIIFDAAGSRSFFTVRRSLKTSGRYITTLPNKPSDILGFFFTPFLSPFFNRQKAMFVNVRPSGADLRHLSLLIKEKEVVPLVDRVFGLEEIAEAHAYSETGHARGKIVIKIA
jgi:NADPH:quinone reductase-like Zn-dependent oxidoreductase